MKRECLICRYNEDNIAEYGLPGYKCCGSEIWCGKKECNHIYGYSDGVDESWLEYKAIENNDPYIDIKFKYCPLCGVKLYL